MKLDAIARYIYNENNTFFSESEEYNRLYRSLESFLLRQSKSRYGTFAKVEGKADWFRIRESVGRQGFLNFNT